MPERPARADNQHLAMIKFVLTLLPIAILMASVAAIGSWAQEDGIWAAGGFVALVIGTAACIGRPGREKAK